MNIGLVWKRNSTTVRKEAYFGDTSVVSLRIARVTAADNEITVDQYDAEGPEFASVVLDDAVYSAEYLAHVELWDTRP